MAFRVLQFADDLNQREQRIGRRPTIHAGVQINLGPHGFNFGVNQSPQAHAQRWEVGGK